MFNRIVSNPVFAGIVSAFLITVFLSGFLVVKIVGEIISWGDSEMYPAKTITVNGEGEVLAVPDIATFSFTVSANEISVDIAQEEATAKINEATAFLKDNGVEEKDIKTTSYNVYPQYNYGNEGCVGFNCPRSNPQIVGYEVSQTTSVKVRQAEEAGRFLNELGEIGISNISGLSFTTDDEEIYREQARDKAIADAKDQAEKLAKQLGVKLDDVVSFGEDQPYMYDSYYGGLGGAKTMEESAMSIAPEISKGENSYTSRVWVTFEID